MIPEEKVIQAMRRHVLTEARDKRGDVRSIPGERGGLEHRVSSYLDVLLESDIITKEQYDYGMVYWSIRDVALYFLDAKIGNYGDQVDEEEGLNDPIYQADEFDGEDCATEIYLQLCRALQHRHRAVIDASCYSIPEDGMQARMAIVWAYTPNVLESAFAALESVYPSAKETALEKIKNPYPQKSIALRSEFAMIVDGDLRLKCF